MREIKYIVVHCTATLQTATVKSILNYWKTGLGWKNPGYHLIVKPNGEYERLAADKTICNGVKGYNSNAIHISYIGGVDKTGNALDNRTAAQKQTLLELICEFKSKYPNAIIQGHRDFPNVKKDCPSFNAINEYKHL
ncbi:MAG TPA: N-acetylmuramoyl-L-alanine amidase [Flavobacterium sp.]|nr:N-acetylmuramoyl-L-alanine amidase [Flavobacterium sp.]